MGKAQRIWKRQNADFTSTLTSSQKMRGESISVSRTHPFRRTDRHEIPTQDAPKKTTTRRGAERKHNCIQTKRKIWLKLQLVRSSFQKTHHPKSRKNAITHAHKHVRAKTMNQTSTRWGGEVAENAQCGIRTLRLNRQPETVTPDTYEDTTPTEGERTTKTTSVRK